MTRPAPPWYLALDVWMALGHDSQEFEPYCGRQNWSWGDVWSSLMVAVRGPCPPCGLPAGSDCCVLSDGHFGPHYGPGDVGRSEVPWRTEPVP